MKSLEVGKEKSPLVQDDAAHRLGPFPASLAREFPKPPPGQNSRILSLAAKNI